MAISFEKQGLGPQTDEGVLDYVSISGTDITEYSGDDYPEDIDFVDKKIDVDFLNFLEGAEWTKEDIRTLKKQWKKVYKELDDLYNEMFDYFLKGRSGKNEFDFSDALDGLLENKNNLSEEYKGLYSDFYSKYHDKYTNLLARMSALDGEISVMKNLHTTLELATLKKDVEDNKKNNVYSKNENYVVDDEGNVMLVVDDFGEDNWESLVGDPSMLGFDEIPVVASLREDDILNNDNKYEWSKEVVNILESNRELKKVMEEVIDEGSTGKKIKKKHFAVNLWQNWLAGFVLYCKNKNSPIDFDNVTKDDLKDFGYIKSGKYKSKVREEGKILKIMKRAKKEDLLEFAYLVESSNTEWRKAVKQSYNFEKVKDNLTADT